MVDIFFSFLVACGNFTRFWRQINKVAPINHQYVGNYYEHLPLVSIISQQNYSLKQQYAALASSILSLFLSLSFFPNNILWLTVNSFYRSYSPECLTPCLQPFTSKRSSLKKITLMFWVLRIKQILFGFSVPAFNTHLLVLQLKQAFKLL